MSENEGGGSQVEFSFFIQLTTHLVKRRKRRYERREGERGWRGRRVEGVRTTEKEGKINRRKQRDTRKQETDLCLV